MELHLWILDQLCEKDRYGRVLNYEQYRVEDLQKLYSAGVKETYSEVTFDTYIKTLKNLHHDGLIELDVGCEEAQADTRGSIRPTRQGVDYLREKTRIYK